MYVEYLLALCEVGQVNVYLTVETSCTQKCLVEHVNTVGGCKDYDTGVCAEAVHLCQQSVEGVLALVVATESWVLAAGTAYCINLINEDDGWCLVLCLGEGVTNA